MWLTLLIGCIPVLHSPGGAVSSDYVVPDNAWPKAETLPPLEGEGFEVGELVEHETLGDQNGQTVDLWQFYGQVWVLDVSTIWCLPCQKMASTLQETANAFAGQDFVYVTILREDDDGEVPDQAELAKWGDDWGIVDQPILADERGFTDAITRGNFPALLVIDRGLRVSARVEVADDSLLAEAIDAAL